MLPKASSFSPLPAFKVLLEIEQKKKDYIQSFSSNEFRGWLLGRRVNRSAALEATRLYCPSNLH